MIQSFDLHQEWNRFIVVHYATIYNFPVINSEREVSWFFRSSSRIRWRHCDIVVCTAILQYLNIDQWTNQGNSFQPQLVAKQYIFEVYLNLKLFCRKQHFPREWLPVDYSKVMHLCSDIGEVAKNGKTEVIKNYVGINRFRHLLVNCSFDIILKNDRYNESSSDDQNQQSSQYYKCPLERFFHKTMGCFIAI